MITPPSRRRAALTMLLAAVLSAPTAGAVASPADPEGTIVNELVVTAKSGGPAWWRVSTPTSTVFVLGLPGPSPKGLKWDTAMTRRRLQGANELIGPPEVTAGIGDLFALLNARKHFRSKGPMENGLSPDLRARFLTDRAALTRDPKAYSGWTPLVAGLLMAQDFRKKAGVDEREPGATVVRLAHAANVKVVPAGSYRAVPVIRAAESGLGPAGPACLGDVLDEIEVGPARITAAAYGWAHGNVAQALSQQRAYEKCLASLPEGADLPTRVMGDTTDAIAKALAKPGYSVAVVNLRTLLAQGGVLQRLKAKGYMIATPNQ